MKHNGYTKDHKRLEKLSKLSLQSAFAFYDPSMLPLRVTIKKKILNDFLVHGFSLLASVLIRLTDDCEWNLNLNA